MATKKAELDSEEFRKEFLECPLCFEMFIEPKVLPCQHSFCLECLQKYVKARGQARTFPCPLCKKNTAIPDNDVSEFPNNFTLANLTDFVKGSVQISYNVTSRHEQCDACGKVRSLETFCSTCELWLCVSCTIAHQRFPLLSSHCLNTNKEVNKHCIEIVLEKEKEVKRLQEEIKQRLTCLEKTKQNIRSNVDDAKQQIKSVAEAARKVINIKEKRLLQELSTFEEKEIQNQRESLREIDVNIDHILQVINEVKESSSGRENQGKVEIIKEFLTNSETKTNPCLSVSVEEYIPVYFTSSNFLAELKNMDMGYRENINTRQLIERPVRLQEITSQDMRGQVYSLAYSTFSNTLLAIVCDSVTVINPDSGDCKPFLLSSSEREMVYPQCVAYSEDECRLFIIEIEGRKRVITSYTHDGKFDSIITSSLTCPIDLAVYGGRIFVCDGRDLCVYVLNMSGEVHKVLKETPDHKALFTYPWYISVGGNGRLAVSDDFHCVHIFDKDYTRLYIYVTDIADPCLTGVQVCDLRNGLHYISDFRKSGLMKFEDSSLPSLWSITIHEKYHTIYIGSKEGKIYSIKY